MKNKGIVTLNLIIILFLMITGVLFIGISVYIFGKINTSLDLDIEMGNVNFKDVKDDTFGQLNSGFLNSADFLGVAVILGMIFLMIGNAFMTGRDYPRLMFVIDLFILFFAFIIAVYLAQAFSLVIGSTEEFNIFRDSMPNSSRFILNLPIYVGIIGSLIMIASYITLTRRVEDEESNVLGY